MPVTSLGCSAGDTLQMNEGEQIIAFRSEWPTRLDRFNYLTDVTLSKRSDPNPRFA